MSNITKEEVLKAQEEWGSGIVAIGVSFLEKADYESRAKEHIEKLYAYEQSAVLFKPTKAAEKPFRASFDSALSYFVATNNWAQEDGGFAIAPWKKVRFDNHEILTSGNTATAMGEYYFTDMNDNEVKVEYTFGYMKDEQGNLRINVHHSSLPFSG